MIPRRFHFVWIGASFGYTSYLAVATCAAQHPGSEIVVHHGVGLDNPKQSHWFDALRKLPNTSLRPIDPNERFSELPVAAEAIERVLDGVPTGYRAGVTNLLRLAILYREGGIYLDCDVVVVAPIDELLQVAGEAFVGEELVWKSDDERVRRNWSLDMIPSTLAFLSGDALARTQTFLLRGHPFLRGLQGKLVGAWGEHKLNNAVIAARARHPFIARALELAAQSDPSVRYGLGPMLINTAWNHGGGDGATRLPPPYLFPIPPSKSYMVFHGRPKPLAHETRVVHWCASNNLHAATRITPERIVADTTPSLYIECVRKALAGTSFANPYAK